MGDSCSHISMSTQYISMQVQILDSVDFLRPHLSDLQLSLIFKTAFELDRFRLHDRGFCGEIRSIRIYNQKRKGRRLKKNEREKYY